MSSHPPRRPGIALDFSAIRFPDFAAEIASGAVPGARAMKRLNFTHGAVLARVGPRREQPVGWIDRMALTRFLESRPRTPLASGNFLGRGAAGWLELLLPLRGEAPCADEIRRVLRRHGAAAAFSRLLRSHWPDLSAFEARFTWGRGPGPHVARVLGADPETGLPLHCVAGAPSAFPWKGPHARSPLGYGYTHGRPYPRHSGEDGGPFSVPGERLMSARTLSVLPSHKGSEIRISAAVYNGRPRLDLRRWVPDRGRPGNYKATRQGVSIEADMVPIFVAYLTGLRPELEAAWDGLLRIERSKEDPRETRSATVIPGVKDLSRS